MVWLVADDFKKRNDYLGKRKNPKGYEGLSFILSEIGDIVINDTLQSANFRKLFDEAATPKQILDELKHRLGKVAYGLYHAHELKDNNFGFDQRTRKHVPLKLGRTSTDVFLLLDEKTDPELFKKYLWQKEHAEELSIFDRLAIRETISVQDRADILLGAFAY